MKCYRMSMTAQVCFTVEAVDHDEAVKVASLLAETWIDGLSVEVEDGDPDLRVYVDDEAVPEVADIEEVAPEEQNR